MCFCMCVCELKMERKQRKWNVETEQLAADRQSLPTKLSFTSLYVPHPYPHLQAFYLESVSVLSPESWFWLQRCHSVRKLPRWWTTVFDIADLYEQQADFFLWTLLLAMLVCLCLCVCVCADRFLWMENETIRLLVEIKKIWRTNRWDEKTVSKSIDRLWIKFPVLPFYFFSFIFLFFIFFIANFGFGPSAQKGATSQNIARPISIFMTNQSLIKLLFYKHFTHKLFMCKIDCASWLLYITYLLNIN